MQVFFHLHLVGNCEPAWEERDSATWATIEIDMTTSCRLDREENFEAAGVCPKRFETDPERVK